MSANNDFRLVVSGWRIEPRYFPKLFQLDCHIERLLYFLDGRFTAIREHAISTRPTNRRNATRTPAAVLTPLLHDDYAFAVLTDLNVALIFSLEVLVVQKVAGVMPMRRFDDVSHACWDRKERFASPNTATYLSI